MSTERPSSLEAAAFRFAGWRLGGARAAWMAEDVRSGRSGRWRLLTCGVTVIGGQLLVRAGFAERGLATAPLWAPLGGGLVGLLLGALLVRFQDVERRVTRTLRSQGLLADGRPDPSPSWSGRLDNFGVAALQLALVAFLGMSAGLVPRLLAPVPRGSCVDAEDEVLAVLRSQTQPGQSVRGIRAVHESGITVISGVVGEGAGRPATWLSYDVDGSPLFPMTPAAVAVARPPGPSSGLLATSATAVKAQGCASRAAAHGEGQVVSVTRPVATVPLGTVRLGGAIDATFEGIAAVCQERGASIVLDGSVFLSVEGSMVGASGQRPTGQTFAYEGSTGVVEAEAVTVVGRLRSRVADGTVLEVDGLVPCVEG